MMGWYSLMVSVSMYLSFQFAFPSEYIQTLEAVGYGWRTFGSL